MNRPLISRVVRMWSLAVLGVVAGATAVALAQEPATHEHKDAAAAPVADKGCAMMAQHKETMAAMAVADQKLSRLVAEMNAATGDAKVAAIAAVVAEIAAQRAQMTKMQSNMMEQMASHKSAMHAAHHPEK